MDVITPHAQLGVAIVGNGAIGDLTADVLNSIAGVRVTARLCGRDPHWGGLGADTQVVAVCSTHGRHVPHALTAVESGRHVVVEKPLSLDVDDGRRLLALARTRGVKVSVISQRRWEPAVAAAHAAVASGVPGKLLLAEALVRWRRDKSYYRDHPWRGTIAEDGGVLFNQAVHVLDLLRFLGGEVELASGATGTLRHRTEAPDTAVAHLRFAGGALGVVSATTTSTSPSPAELNLHFENGMIRFADERVVEWSVPGIASPATLDAVGSGSADPRAIGLVGHRRQWSRIVDDLRTGREPAVAGEDALRTVALVAAIHASAERGGAPIAPEQP